MKMKKIYILLILMAFTGISVVSGQTKSAFLNAAQNAYEAEDYYSAFSYYKEVLEFDVKDPQVYYNAANAARKFHAYTYADSLYSVVLEKDDNNLFPLATFYAAQVKQKLGQYDKAKEYYSLYISEQGGDDPVLTARAEDALTSLDWAINEIEYYGTEQDSIVRLEGVNTPYSEFGSYMLGDDLYFSSLRFEESAKDVYPDKLYSKVLVSTDGNGGGKIFGEDLQLSSGQHVAHTTFNEDHSTMYFTLCEYITVDDIRCDLFHIGFEDGETEGTASMIQFGDSGSGYTYTQPSWGYVNDVEVLFFVSDRAGGKGKNDIWYTEIKENGTFGQPVNLEAINTSEDDITPFFDKDTKTLYFSSEGYEGFGGFDIYISQNYNGEWTEVSNAGHPLNSSYDDIYAMIDQKSDKVYFSSNRPGSLLLDDELEGCCFDIYKGELPFMRHKLIVEVYDGYTLEPVYGANVDLINSLNNMLLETQQDPDEYIYRFRVQRNKNYIIEGTKGDYLPGVTEFSTINLPDTGDIVQKVYLVTKELHLDVFVFDEKTRNELRGAEVTMIDNLGNTTELLNLDSNDFHYALDRDKTYTFIVSRKGYSPVSFELDPADYQNQSLIKKDVYLPTGTLEDFLPLVLYFDNDMPNPRSWARNTNLRYTDTYGDYYERKQQFIDVFTEPLEGTEMTQAKSQLDNFFETEVRKGYMDISEFLALLEAALDEGKKVEIFLQGYTSPRASAAYNLNLGMRRIQSAKNQIIDYNDGVLNKYINNSQLEIKLKSFGKTTAPSDVISDLSDERNSIYSYKASKERRVEIIGINIE